MQATAHWMRTVAGDASGHAASGRLGPVVQGRAQGVVARVAAPLLHTRGVGGCEQLRGCCLTWPPTPFGGNCTETASLPAAATPPCAAHQTLAHVFQCTMTTGSTASRQPAHLQQLGLLEQRVHRVVLAAAHRRAKALRTGAGGKARQRGCHRACSCDDVTSSHAAVRQPMPLLASLSLPHLEHVCHHVEGAVAGALGGSHATQLRAVGARG